jgi:hypothetical protein
MQIFRKIFIVKKVNLKMEVFRQFDVLALGVVGE